MGVTTNRRRAAGHSGGGGGTDYSKMYFTIESLEDGCVVSVKNVNCNILPTFYYSTDNGQTWSSVTMTKSSTKTTATIDTGETVIFKCTQNSHATGWDNYNGFQCSKDYKVYGNAMSLIYGDNFTSNSEFASGTSNNLVALFREDTHIIDASNLVFPALTVTGNCHNGMFRDCVNLERAMKVLPATTGNDSCYASMFEGCINLEEAPEIEMVSISSGGSEFKRMFCMSRTTKLTTPKMTKSPVLKALSAPANTQYIYEEMFKGNGNLVEVTCLATSFDTNAYKNWLQNCSNTGTFKKAASMSSWPSGTSGIPSGWTVEDYVET